VELLEISMQRCAKR